MTDPRIAALAKDPRTGPMWPSIVESDGRLAQSPCADELDAFDAAMKDHELFWVDPVGSELLAYLRGLADELVAAAGSSQRRTWSQAAIHVRGPQPTDDTATALVAAVLRGESCEAWAGVDACQASDDLVEAGLLTPDEEPEPLQITPLGRAVLLVLEQRLPPALPEPELSPIERLLVAAGR